MIFTSLYEIFEIIGGIVGICITLITFWGIISKRPKAYFKNLIDTSIKENTSEILKKLDKHDAATLVSLRHSITGIYEKYKDEKKLPIHVKEDLCSLYSQYRNFNGNSYIVSLMELMEEWEIE